MADVTLILKADNSQYVNKMKEAQQASQKVFDTVEKGTKREKGLIEDIEQELTKLQEKRKKAFTIEDIEKYNKKLQEAKKDLEAYENAGVQTQKTTESMTQSIGKWVMGLGLAVTILNALKKALLDTRQGMIIFNEAGAAMKQVLYNIVSGVQNWNQGVGEAIILARQMAELQIKDSQEKLKANKLMREYNRLYTDANEIAGTSVERITKLTQAKERFTEAINIEIESTKEQLIIANKQWKNAADSESARKAVMDLANELSGLIEQRDKGIRRLSRTVANETAKLFSDVSDEIKNNFVEIEKWEKDYEEDKKKAREKAIEDKKRELENYGNWLIAHEEWLAEQVEKEWDENTKFYKLLFEQNKKAGEDAGKALDEQIENKKKKDKEGADFTRGLLEESFNLTVELENAIFDMKAQKISASLDKELNALDAKTKQELAKAGNDESKKQHILEKSEAKKLEIEKKYRRQQQKMDVQQAIVNGILSVAKTFALFGWPLGIIPASIMSAIVGVQVATIKAATFAKGGWTGKGDQRDHTGERIAGVVHGEEFVIKRGPALKFREVLEAINKGDQRLILNKFNKLSPELMGGTTVNNVIVENEGPNKRLDKVNEQLRQLNRRQSKEEIIELAGMTIIKKGSSTRIVRR